MKFKRILNIINMPSDKTYTDVVGLEISADSPTGIPAVRLRQHNGILELLAAGFLRLPGTMPKNPDEAQNFLGVSQWHLPKPFQAPHAALAIHSNLAFLRHATSNSEDSSENKPLSYRHVTHSMGTDLPPLVAGLPEFQAAWAAALLPEGYRPTACSLQLATTAAINGFISSPAFNNIKGGTIALLIFPDYTALVAFQDHHLVLYREHPVGIRHVRNAISTQMRIDDATVDALLEDTLIDPLPMIEPVLRPLFRQAEISVDYLVRRKGCPVQNFFACGLSTGACYWNTIFTQMMNHPLTNHQPLNGIQIVVSPACLPDNFDAVAPLFMTAIGAARAVLENI